MTAPLSERLLGWPGAISPAHQEVEGDDWGGELSTGVLRDSWRSSSRGRVDMTGQTASNHHKASTGWDRLPVTRKRHPSEIAVAACVGRRRQSNQMSPRLHDEEVPIDAALVRRLVRDQFP